MSGFKSILNWDRKNILYYNKLKDNVSLQIRLRYIFSIFVGTHLKFSLHWLFGYPSLAKQNTKAFILKMCWIPIVCMLFCMSLLLYFQYTLNIAELSILLLALSNLVGNQTERHLVREAFLLQGWTNTYFSFNYSIKIKNIQDIFSVAEQLYTWIVFPSFPSQT